MPMTVAQGKRSSASRSYLRPVKDRRNLQVLPRPRFSIEMQNQAICVEVMLKGQIERLTAKEISCAGAINSPQLLMLSGIGPGAQLQSMGLETLVDSPQAVETTDHLEV